MTTAQAIKLLVDELPAELQRELLDFGEFLKSKGQALPSGKQAFPSLRGACKDLRSGVSVEEIRQVRKEMWAAFPREDIS